MQYHRIPHSSLEVSTLGLGTMTFGEQNSEADAHAHRQMQKSYLHIIRNHL